ncbi:MAG: histidine phosphatase family protein [Parasporobacterium sp.]|nr:histidine phosphatase family protein [Parasporobacterium sp.]
MRIYIIRHGETPANEAYMFQGRSDYPLNEKGIKLAEITGMGLKDIKFAAAFSSPLVRARQTAELVLAAGDNKDVQVIIDDRIQEISFGDWEGKRFREEFNEVPPDKARTFFRNPFELVCSPNGEKVTDLCSRTQEFLKELAANEEYKDSNVLVATHGCALRAMLNFLYDDPSDFWQGHVPYNCVVNIVEAADGMIKLAEGDKIYYDSSFCVDRYKEK